MTWGSNPRWKAVPAFALGGALALAPLVAAAQGQTAHTYRCVGKDGKKYYGQTLPRECIGEPVELLNSRGMVVRRIDARAEAEARAAKEAEDKRKAEAAAVAKEEERRRRALLATYTSEQDIEYARNRSLEENRTAVQNIENRIAQIRKQQERYAKELEFYSGKNKPPAKLEQDIKGAEHDLKLQRDLLEAKKKEVETINARYDEERQRFLELTRPR